MTSLELRSDIPRSTQSQALENFVQVLRRRTGWIIAPFVLCMLAVIAYTVTSKPTYESTVTIELNKNGHGADLGISNELNDAIGGGGDTLLTDLETETAILEDDSLALSVIKQLHLANQPPFAPRAGKSAGKPLSFEQVEASPEMRARLLDAFRARLHVRPNPGTRLLQVSFDSHDPDQAAAIANALVEAYKNYYLQSHYDAITDTSRWLTTQLSDLKGSVNASEKRLTDFEKASGIIGLDLGGGQSSPGQSNGGISPQIHSPVIQKLDELNSELTQAEATRIAAEAVYRITASGKPDVVLGMQGSPLLQQAGSSVISQGAGMSRLQTLRNLETQLQLQIAQDSATMGPRNRHLQDLQVQLKTLDAQIGQELELIRRRAKADLDLATQTEQGIRHQFEQQQRAASKLNDVAIQFAMLSEEASSHKRLYEDLYTKLQEANVAAGIQATNITVVDPARASAKPIKPKPVEYIALGGLFGLFLGLGTAYTVEALDRTVASPQEVELITGKPVIGIIPELREAQRGYSYRLPAPTRKRSELAAQPVSAIWVSDHPDSTGSESIRALRTAIMLSRADAVPRAVLVTSCVPGEGKTTVSLNLAYAFALHHKRVILVEADMRRPRIAAALQMTGDLGLSHVLTGAATFEEAVDRGRMLPTLDILAGGPPPPNPSEILGGTSFERLIEKLRDSYDLVLIDSPPALLVTDATLISTKVDAAIWVARAGRITRPELARAAGMIERGKMPVIGFAMNGLSAKLAGYGYGYEYDHYDSYYRKGRSDNA